MEEFKGTKGEWMVNGNNIQVNPENPMETESICVLFGSGNEKFANAKLIAAAPDLLNALKECMVELYSIHSQYGDKENALEHSHALTISEKAINKALK